MTGTGTTPLTPPPPDAKRRETWLILAAIFTLSRLVYYAAGVRFDAGPLRTFFQIYDPELLRHRLLETLWYSHTQPPGFNLLIGIVLKLFPEHNAVAFHAIYLLCGVVTMFCVYEMMRALAVERWIAVAVTALFIASPGVVLFENLLIYEPLALALLCGAAVCFHRIFASKAQTGPAGPPEEAGTRGQPTPPGSVVWASFSRSSWPLWGFFGLLLSLVMLRSLFQLAYLVCAAAILLAALPSRRKMVIAAAAAPLALTLGLYAKNWALYGSFNSSTWMGFNIYTITTHQLTPEEKERFITEGRISPLERAPTLASLSDYKDYIRIPPPTGIPILDQQTDSTGRSNFNHPGYFQIHKTYLKDGAFLLRNYPKAYARSVTKAWFAYFLPSSDFPFFTANRERIGAFDRLFNLAVFGQFRVAADRKELRKMEAAGQSVFSLMLYTGTFLMAGLPALFVWGVWLLWRGWRGGALAPPTAALLSFLLFHILMITLMVNLLSSFENNRYRLPIDGFFVVLAGLALSRVSGALRSRRAGTGNTDAARAAAC